LGRQSSKVLLRAAKKKTEPEPEAPVKAAAKKATTKKAEEPKEEKKVAAKPATKKAAEPKEEPKAVAKPATKKAAEPKEEPKAAVKPVAKKAAEPKEEPKVAAKPTAKTAVEPKKEQKAPEPKPEPAKLEKKQEEVEEEAADDGNAFRPGDYVKARYHKDNSVTEAIILYRKGGREGADQEIYDVSWDEPEEGEQITSVLVNRIQLIRRGKKGTPEFDNVPLKPGDLLWALYLEDQKWYDAVLEKIDESGKTPMYTVKWDDPDPDTHSTLVRRDVKLRLRKW